VLKLYSFFLAVLLSCQLTLTVAAYGSMATAIEVHQVFSQNQEIDHHHHDGSFATHFDHANGETAHQHVTDGFQAFALLAEVDSLSNISSSSVLIAFNSIQPLTIFLDGLLRPPRVLV
jgi:hypothetical protein